MPSAGPIPSATGEPVRNEPVGEHCHDGDTDWHAQGGIGGSESGFEDADPAGGQLRQGVDQIGQAIADEKNRRVEANAKSRETSPTAPPHRQSNPALPSP